jgi:hypothetical protein
MDYTKFDDGRIKHLEMIQAVVARLGGNGFLIKGWAITVAGVFVGLAVNAEDCSFARVGAASSFVFWGLDAYFLRAERRFRSLYERICAFDTSVRPFFMGATAKSFIKTFSRHERRRMSWSGAAGSWTLVLFYGTLVATSVGASLLV